MVTVVAGANFVASVLGPGGFETGVGARVEVPVTRAIVSMFVLGVLNPDGTWTAQLYAPALPGEYEVVWMTTDPVQPDPFPIYQPLFVTALVDVLGIGGTDWPVVDLASVTPTADDVAQLERTRTRDEDTGQEYGTFNANTRPTDTDVDLIIDQTVPVVLSQFRKDFDPALYDEVKHAVVLLTASIVETSYFRNQAEAAGQGMGTAQAWKALYNQTVAGVQGKIAFDLTQNLIGQTLQ